MSPSIFRTAFPAAAVTLAFLASSLFTGASGQSLRCKGDLAQIGNSKSTILQKCGEPVMKDSFCKPVQETVAGAPVVVPAAPGGSANSASVTTNITVNSCQQVEEWTYNPGYGQFMTMLQFEGGSLKTIRYGDRVTR
jgi:hypothetical protein